MVLLTPTSTAVAQWSGLMEPIVGLESKFLTSHPPQQENSFSQTPQIFPAALPSSSRPIPTPQHKFISIFITSNNADRVNGRKLRRLHCGLPIDFKITSRDTMFIKRNLKSLAFLFKEKIKFK